MTHIHRILLSSLLMLAYLAIAYTPPALAQELGDTTGQDAEPALALRYTEEFLTVYSSAGSDADDIGYFHIPVVPPGYVALTHLATGPRLNGDPLTPAPYALVAKELVAGALALPADYLLLWTDADSGADQDGALWRPIPPPGYVCLSDVAQSGYGKPAPATIHCVRQDLAVPAKAKTTVKGYGKSPGIVWSDFPADSADIAVWPVVPKTTAGSAIGIELNAFSVASYVIVKEFRPFPLSSVLVPIYQVPEVELWTLKRSAVARPELPAGKVEELISKHGPTVVMHPQEQFLPDDPIAVLNSDPLLCSGLIDDKNGKEDEDKYNNFSQHDVECHLTSAATLLSDVETAKLRPIAADPKFKIYLDRMTASKSGNLARAKAWVRVMPRDHVFVEVQFWIYYPYNGSGKAMVRATINPFGTSEFPIYADPIGRHTGDWESVRLRFAQDAFGDDSYKLVQTILSRHGDEYIYSNKPIRGANGLLRDPFMGFLVGHPKIYSAVNSHAHYSTAGNQYYQPLAGGRLSSVASFNADLWDVTGDSQLRFELYKPENYQIVFSEWPTVAATAPDALYFKERWGRHEPLKSTIADFGPTIPYAYQQFEIGSGPTGPIDKKVWAYSNDATAPTVTSRVIGLQRLNSPWYVTDVKVSWQVDDPESVLTQEGCEPVTLTADTKDAALTCSATSEGGRTKQTKVIGIDRTPPTITPIIIPLPNANGWNNSPMGVQYECIDETSGVAACTPDQVYTENVASQFVQGTARDNAGNSSQSDGAYIRIDTVAPGFNLSSPVDLTYGNTTQIPFQWTASDILSGIESEVALLDATPMANGQIVEASTLALGEHTVSLKITDIAGNVQETTFDLTIVDGPGDNINPIFTSTPLDFVNAGIDYTYAITTIDANRADTLTITATEKPDWLTITDNGDGTATLKGLPDNSQTGEHTVILQVEDNAGATDTQFFIINVTNIVLFTTNEAPQPQNDDASVAFNSEQNRLDVLANDDDPNGDPLTIIAVSQPLHGTATFNDAEILYWPENGISGTEIFSYTVSDGRAMSLTATAMVTVTILDGPENQAPIAVGDSAEVDFGSAQNRIAVLENDSDPDGDPLTLDAVGAPAHGFAFVLDGAIIYTPNPGYSGADSLPYTLGDGRGGIQTGSVLITVLADPLGGPNSAPSAIEDGKVVAIDSKDNVVEVLANDSDPDGDSLSIVHVSPAVHGTTTLTDDAILYSPEAEYSGEDIFSYTISDGKGGTQTAIVRVNVGEVPPENQNSTPSAVDDNTPVTANSTDNVISVLANDSDPDGDALTLFVLTQPISGTAIVSGTQIVYTPLGGFIGNDSFTYNVSDGKGGSASATVTITAVDPAVSNQQPTAADDAATTGPDTAVTIDVATNDSDADGDTLTITIDTQPTNGTVMVSSGQIVYTPKAGFSGSESFRYSISDGRGGSAIATVTVAVGEDGAIMQDIYLPVVNQ